MFIIIRRAGILGDMSESDFIIRFELISGWGCYAMHKSAFGVKDASHCGGVLAN